MISLVSLIDALRAEGYSEANAQARVCQDIVLRSIDKSNFSSHITVKGGVVMRGITRNSRRATQDMDLDFIRYSLDDRAIIRFIDSLNCLDGISIAISGNIEELSQQEYHGKRVYITITDTDGFTIRSKIDLGVHARLELEQDTYCFDVCMDNLGASLLINSKEQIFTEKLRSLLRFGAFSTRYKDVFDLCYLIDVVDTKRLLNHFETCIFSDQSMRENNMSDIVSRIGSTFSNGSYFSRLRRSQSANWLNIPVDEAVKRILAFLEKLQEE